MTTKDIRQELLNEDILDDKISEHIVAIGAACNKLKFMGRFIKVLKDLEELVRNDDRIRTMPGVEACLAAIDKVLDF